MSSLDPARLRALLAETADAQQAFLAELVKVPSDNPPATARPTPGAPPSCWRASASRWSAMWCRRTR